MSEIVDNKEEILRVEDLKMYFPVTKGLLKRKIGDVKAVDGVSFSINKGEFVVILGPSGAGKSTLLNLLGGMDKATSGEIIVGNKNIEGYSDSQLTEYRAENIGFIFQFYNIMPTLTVDENVNLIKDVTNTSKDSLSVLKSVGLLKHKDKFPQELSGGEQQRVSIARALSKNPKLILGDEPTGALDSETGVMVLDLIQRMAHEKGNTVILVTHNADIAQCADKVIRMRSGKIREIKINENPVPVKEVEW